MRKLLVVLSTMVISVLSLTLLSSAVYAYTVKHTLATDNSSSPGWHFRVAPYLWAINMDGTTQIGTRRAHIDETFSDILNHLSFAGMVWLEADKDNWGIFLNSLYSVLTDTAHDGPLSLNAKSRFGLFTAGVSYKIYQSDKLGLIPFIGFRYTINHVELTANTPTITVSAKDNQNWINPLVGARLIYAFKNAWSITLEGDVGGTNTSTDYSYNFTGLVGYKPQTKMTHSTIYFGYRLLNQHYKTGSGTSTYVWNMKIAGPMLGIAFDFA